MKNSPLMSYKEYAKAWRNSSKYLIKAKKFKLYYFGVSHSYDPENLMFAKIEQEYKKFHPDLVVVEGISNLDKRRKKIVLEQRGKTRKQILSHWGEVGLGIHLATKDSIDFDSPEPSFADEIRILNKQYFPEQLFVFYLLRDLSQWHRFKKKPDLKKYLRSYIPNIKHSSNWKKFDYSLDNFFELLPTVVGNIDMKNQKEINSLVDPVPWKKKDFQITNKISEASSKFRDEYILKKIKDYTWKYKNIFVIYGATHAVMQRRALEYLAKEKGE